ncbi:MAG: hypothetical protein ACQETM_02200, partial [Bacteroidota bacterium]
MRRRVGWLTGLSRFGLILLMIATAAAPVKTQDRTEDHEQPDQQQSSRQQQPRLAYQQQSSRQQQTP